MANRKEGGADRFMCAPFFLLAKGTESHSFFKFTAPLRSPFATDRHVRRFKKLAEPAVRPLWRFDGCDSVGVSVRQLLQRITGGPVPPYITFFPAVMLVAMLGGFWPGVFATLLSSFVIASWILTRGNRLDITPVDQVSLGIFICAGFVMSVFADVYRQTRQPGRGL